jgi:2-methylcitrate dehydratase PrpD
VFGAAAAAAEAVRLDAAETRHALGIAFIQASGTQQANIEPSLTKRMLSAFAARAGVYAATLAKRGITAPSEVIEGPFGLYQLYQDGDPERLLDGLGERYDNANLSVKKYPSCGCNHTAIEAMLKLVCEYDLKPEDVKSIEVTIGPYLHRIVGGPYDPSGDPQVAAQFSILYSVACVLVRRRLGLEEIEEPAARDPMIGAQIPKISLRVEPAYHRRPRTRSGEDNHYQPRHARMPRRPCAGQPRGAHDRARSPGKVELVFSTRRRAAEGRPDRAAERARARARDDHRHGRFFRGRFARNSDAATPLLRLCPA